MVGDCQKRTNLCQCVEGTYPGRPEIRVLRPVKGSSPPLVWFSERPAIKGRRACHGIALV
jgi:hypothetical protein